MASQILILDDEKNYLLILEALLTDAGYAVTALDDPETGLAYLEESEVDVVITDMKCPRSPASRCSNTSNAISPISRSSS